MPLQLAEIQEDDCTTFAIVEEAVAVDWPLARAMEQGQTSRRDMFEQWFKGKFGKDPSEKWMKVVDSETGEMVAGALWRAVEPSSEQAEEGTKDPVESDAQQSVAPGGTIPPVFLEMARRWKAFQDEFIGDNPFVNLQMIVTHPKHQRKGAASMLVKYGTDLADERGIPCALTASEVGHMLYLRHGFEVVKTTEMDLRPYGVEATAPRIGMVRPARAKGRA